VPLALLLAALLLQLLPSLPFLSLVSCPWLRAKFEKLIE
jgi:hypothetical protein